MKTQEIIVTSSGTGMETAFSLTEKAAAECGLDKKQTMRLRLLTEELFGTMRGIAGDIEGVYYLEYEGKSFVIHMDSEVVLTADMKKKFLEVSSTGENAGVKSFMGKLRDMIANVLLAMDADPSMLQMGLMSMGSPVGVYTGFESYEWYMKKYKEALSAIEESDENTEEAWDELEKSIVANIADDISISVVGSKVGIAISKAF